MEEEKEKKKINPLWNVLKTEWIYLGSRRKIFLGILLLFVIAAAIGLTTPLVVGLIFNSIQESITSDGEFKKLILMIWLLLGIQIGFWIFHGAGRILEQRTGFFVHKNFTASKINKVLELPIKWHKDHHSGDTIDKINRGRNSVLAISSDYTADFVYAIMNIFGSLFILFFVDWKIAAFASGFSFILLLIIMGVDRKLINYYKELNKYSNKLSSSIFDYLSNIYTVITLRLKKTVSQEIDYKLMASYKTEKKSIYLNEFKWGFANASISLMTVLVLSYKVYADYTSTGVILIGTLYILYGYLGKVGQTFFKFASLYGKITRHSARIEGSTPIDEAFNQIKERIGGTLPHNWDRVDVKNIKFTYDQEGHEQHMDNVNISFKRGQKIALIGESGSGKSTILALMRALYYPDKGDVYADGVKIKNGFEKLKRHVTLIPQDPEIFNNTIRYNVTMDLRTSEEELQEAIHMAQFEKVVKRLEKGLDTNVLEKGVSLSGGEKQRLALARGLLAARNTEIVLMDEPTSSVDSLNEMKIHENVFREFKNKTIISSIHRLHLLSKFDYIYMFDKGKIVAEGTLNDLRKNPKFSSIWRKYGMGGK
ncbi:MAG TPA: ABC transporter ATP-binding protein [Candidatus Pacearchaeota archaeon]|nr:putative multidrug resistance ABC transporter ATP-binding/permease protein YheH [archaeon BMS3Abin17]HDK42014.1 ABC transporter ATP-binding protein [Candidatus Pacearchaeota archaeon]HDZ60853.1 ABC transporter ATP-binding protein [Candidatus Pacearchaeota archaeon]